MRFNAETSERPKIFARGIGLSTIEKLIEWESQLMEAAGLLSHWGQAIGDGSKVDCRELADAALGDVCIRTNPRKVSAEDLVTILEETR